MEKATRATDAVTFQGTDCSLGLREEIINDESEDGKDPGAQVQSSCFNLPPGSTLFSGSALAGGAHHLVPWLSTCELRQTTPREDCNLPRQAHSLFR